MNGIIILDKPPGITSHDAVDAVRRLAGKVKVGHAGTLDPHATGVLILLLGKATKVSRFLMGLEKEYVFTMKLGLETDTLDRWGKTLSETDVVEKSKPEIAGAASKLEGRYDQVAPAVSALKHHGVPLYRLARRGERVPEKVRSVEIRRFDILDTCHPFVTARVVCSSGTYVRSLARDMGRLLGCAASVFCLRRTRIGTFGLSQSVSFGSVLESAGALEGAVLPLAEALGHLPQVRLRPEGVKELRAGKQPRPEGLHACDLDFRGNYAVLVDGDGEPVAIAKKTGEPGRVLRTERVL
jgi:tRNA pseudouridine55 synthase